MKRIVSTACVAAAASLLLGCAGLNSPSAAFETDHERMARAERAARLSGVQLQWINPPLRQVQTPPR
jgi:hypothetical protein